ncbi:hypothetical protein [Polycladidibacter stylochi]|uniref:hypothetical protein n=1 Tax=Polycladidibacter stylochi TaxID=1807766 RepID=UPI000A768F63|nr:hypothetical protein [Pseudovibrio stylochi]
MKTLVTIVLTAFVVYAYLQLSIFVVKPLAGIHEGETLIIKRQENLNFIDSAEAVCQRSLVTTNPVCQATALSLMVNKNNVVLRLPYIKFLHDLVS